MLKQLSVICAALLFAAPLFSAHEHGDGGKLDEYQEDLDERDWDGLSHFLRSKRDEDKKEEEKKDGKDSKTALLISGDVRSDFRSKTETLKGESLLGSDVVDHKGVIRGHNKFTIEANFRVDYDLEKSWMVFHLQYYNKAGIDDELGCVDGGTCYCNELFGSGICDDICLKKAYFGYALYECGDSELDIEIGRRNLYDVFDSKVQFLQRFDGILLSWESTIKDVMDYYGRIAGFVVDYRSNHYAWITEIGALKIYGTGLDLKYSLIDWNKNGVNRCSDQVKCPLPPKPKLNEGDEEPQQEVLIVEVVQEPCCGNHHPDGTKFLISQWTASYSIKKDVTCLDVPMRIFGAFLWNHDDPKPKPYVPKQNKAWYAALRIGDMKKEGDWAWQVMYQYVEALSVPDLDVSGIGNGNTLDGLIITDGFGNTNYKGWRFDGIYAFTDEISINARYEWSNQIKKKFFNCGRHFFSQFKIEMVYAF